MGNKILIKLGAKFQHSFHVREWEKLLRQRSEETNETQWVFKIPNRFFPVPEPVFVQYQNRFFSDAKTDFRRYQNGFFCRS